LPKVAKVGPIKFAARSGGHTPLMAACREGHTEVVQLLCEKAADKDRIMGRVCYFCPDCRALH